MAALEDRPLPATNVGPSTSRVSPQVPRANNNPARQESKSRAGPEITHSQLGKQYTSGFLISVNGPDDDPTKQGIPVVRPASIDRHGRADSETARDGSKFVPTLIERTRPTRGGNFANESSKEVIDLAWHRQGCKTAVPGD